MLRQLIASITVFGAAVRAATGTTYSFNTESGCSTASGTGGKVPQSVPTDSSSSTIYTTLTSAEVTVPSTVIVTAPVVTSTQLTATSYTYIEATITYPTSIVWIVPHSTVATATWPTTVCTNGVEPVTTVTEYSGTYTPISGQVTTIPATYPTRVLCTTAITWLTILLPTATSGVTTVTVTPTSVVAAPTTTTTTTYSFITTAYATTVTSTTTTYLLDTSVATVSTSCAATATTTYAAKCAPTNVISGVEDRGIVSGTYAANNAVIYVSDETYNDPSACCQLCVDNEECGASMSGFDGFCGLLYVGAPNGGAVCEFTFSYQTQSDAFPGQSLWVQSGCGEIDYTGPDGV